MVNKKSIATQSDYFRTKFKPRAENPTRIQSFKTAMNDMSWNPENMLVSLDSLFSAVDDLADAELRYYYKRRRTRAWVSRLTRLGAWIFGSIGFIIPMLAATNNPSIDMFTSFGYVFIAMSGSLLAANALFGGTDGHIRFVTTQLEIEKVIIKARVSWCEYLASQKVNGVDVNSKIGFEIISKYANDLHVKTINETGKWGQTLVNELTKYKLNLTYK